ncbi:MAG: FtsW/RodA/SpoVE family cell cycle protein [Oscillospiraceae bacterium]
MKNNTAFKQFLEQTDFVFLSMCGLCSGISVCAIYAIYKTMNAIESPKVALVQLLASLAGIAIAILLSIIDYKELCEWFQFHSAAVYLLMILTAFIGFAPPGTTNKAWIALPFGLSLQPSELLKISMIITLAHFLDKYHDSIDEINVMAKLVGIALIPFAFVAFQKDGGTMLVYALIIASMFFAAGVSWKLVGMGIGGAFILSPILWWKMGDYQKNRILALFNPDSPEFKTILDQQNSGEISIGSGQLFGKGFFANNHNAVPLPQNDFMFSFLAESVGFIGTILLICLILAIAFRILSISQRSVDLQGSYICVGVFAMLIFQSIINIGMNLTVLPVIGITLPLFSAGGTSVVATYCAIGLVLSVARHNKKSLF